MDRMTKELVLGGKVYTFYTLASLGRVIRQRTKNGGLRPRSRSSFLKLIDRGIIPDANFRDEQDGRLYSKDVLVPALKEIFKGIGQGRAITIEQKMEIVAAFEDERRYFEQLL